MSGWRVSVSENSVSEKSLGFGIGNLVSEKKSGFRKILSRIKGLGVGFGKFGIRKKSRQSVMRRRKNH